MLLLCALQVLMDLLQELELQVLLALNVQQVIIVLKELVHQLHVEKDTIQLLDQKILEPQFVQFVRLAITVH